ncbi:hypothetical protein LLE49_02490 [Alicyclobacillus tolerans]|uniref:hypothetical protein n=1 Tax=Alicyclobacillus tolerans TaxID=90970 RepID=UPI001F15BEB5|nr:hypothetical protein [Alicyclobacillus tolerans]MCF8563606.1 hypothetical protein [Alicyclobacillus tolerans]
MRDGLALLVGAALVLVVLRSLFSHWTHPEAGVPLQGKLHAARAWLEGNGYQVVRVRPHAQWSAFYDTQEFQKALSPDFIVRKGAKSFAVLVMQYDEKPVQDQIGENWYPLIHAFGVDGVLHIDVDRERVHSVDFEVKAPSYMMWKAVFNRVMWVLAGVLMALAWLHGR